MFDGELLYKNIKTIAHFKHIKMGELEQKVGLSPGYFSRTGKGNKSFTVEKIYNVAEILGVTVDTLLHELPKISNEVCPFCGGEPAISGGGGELYYITCLDCFAEGPGRDTQDEAEAAWNKRIYGDYEELYDWGKIFKEQEP